MRKPLLEVEQADTRSGATSIFYDFMGEAVYYFTTIGKVTEDIILFIAGAIFIMPEESLEMVEVDKYVFKRNLDDVIIHRKENDDRIMIHFSSSAFANAFMNLVKISDTYLVRQIVKSLMWSGNYE